MLYADIKIIYLNIW